MTNTQRKDELVEALENEGGVVICGKGHHGPKYADAIGIDSLIEQATRSGCASLDEFDTPASAAEHLAEFHAEESDGATEALAGMGEGQACIIHSGSGGVEAVAASADRREVAAIAYELLVEDWQTSEWASIATADRIRKDHEEISEAKEALEALEEGFDINFGDISPLIKDEAIKGT